jgi:hypothetical protein
LASLVNHKLNRLVPGLGSAVPATIFVHPNIHNRVSFPQSVLFAEPIPAYSGVRYRQSSGYFKG